MSVGRQYYERQRGVEVREKRKQFRRFAREGDEQDRIVLSHFAQITVQSFRGMKIGGVNLEAVHCRHEFLGDVPGFSDTADDELAFVAFEARYC